MKSYSQNSEDLFVLHLFDRPGIFLELGAGNGEHFSNCKLLREHGWNGLSIDADNHGNPAVIKDHISVENIGSYLPEKLDFLSIDLDGNDYWILQEIFKSVYPKCVCLEINSQLPMDKAIVINYDAKRTWDGSYAYGMSYQAAFDLLKHNGYQVIRNCNNTNLIAVKDLVTLNDCGKTYSHAEVVPEGSKWLEVIVSKWDVTWTPGMEEHARQLFKKELRSTIITTKDIQF